MEISPNYLGPKLLVKWFPVILYVRIQTILMSPCKWQVLASLPTEPVAKSPEMTLLLGEDANPFFSV